MDAFSRVVQSTNLDYTLEILEGNSIASVTVNKTTNQSKYDMVISFTSVSAERLQTVDFSTSVAETRFTAELLPVSVPHVADGP